MLSWKCLWSHCQYFRLVLYYFLYRISSQIATRQTDSIQTDKQMQRMTVLVPHNINSIINSHCHFSFPLRCPVCGHCDSLTHSHCTALPCPVLCPLVEKVANTLCTCARSYVVPPSSYLLLLAMSPNNCLPQPFSEIITPTRPILSCPVCPCHFKQSLTVESDALYLLAECWSMNWSSLQVAMVHRSAGHTASASSQTSRILCGGVEVMVNRKRCENIQCYAVKGWLVMAGNTMVQDIMERIRGS